MSIKYPESARIPVPDPSNVCAISLPKSDKSNLPVHLGSDNLICLSRTHPGNMAYTPGFQTLKQNHLSAPEFQVSRLGGGGTDMYFFLNSPKRL